MAAGPNKALKRDDWTNRLRSRERMNLALTESRLQDMMELTPREQELVALARMKGESNLNSKAVRLPAGPISSGRMAPDLFNLETFALGAAVDREATLRREPIWNGLKGRPVLKQDR